MLLRRHLILLAAATLAEHGPSIYADTAAHIAPRDEAVRILARGLEHAPDHPLLKQLKNSVANKRKLDPEGFAARANRRTPGLSLTIPLTPAPAKHPMCRRLPRRETAILPPP